MILQLAFSVALVLVLTKLTFSACKDSRQLTEFYTHLAGAVTFASYFIALGQAFSSWKVRRASRELSKRHIGRYFSLGIFIVMGLVAAFSLASLIVSSLVLYSQRHEATISWEEISARLLWPGCVFVLFLALSFKVHAVRMLDQQKSRMQELLEEMHSLDPSRDERARLDKLSHLALGVLSCAGHQESLYSTGLSAVLFLADPQRKLFIPVGAAGTNDYTNALSNQGVPYFDFEQFREKYGEFHTRTSRRMSDAERQKELAAFRHQVRSFSSITGLVYSTERVLLFSGDLTRESLFFRGEFLEQISEFAKPFHRFHQALGIPLFFENKKLGVLLLLAAPPRTFYPKDRVYRLIRDMLGIRLGLAPGSYSDLIKGASARVSIERVDELVAWLNELAPDFSRPDGAYREKLAKEARVLNREIGVVEVGDQDSGFEIISFRFQSALREIKAKGIGGALQTVVGWFFGTRREPVA